MGFIWKVKIERGENLAYKVENAQKMLYNEKMKLTVLAHRTYAGAAQMLIDRLKDADERDLMRRRFVIVPERLSFAAESKLVESLGATFTSVYSFKRLADTFLPRADFLSKASSIIALTGVVAKNREKLVCYKKGVDSYGFISNLYEIIGQLKYSMVTPRELARSTAPAYLKAKLADISLLYEEYEKFINNRFYDAPDRIKALISSLPTLEWLERAEFFLMDFDCFTAQETCLVKELLKRSAGITVACTFSEDKLYPNEVYNQIRELSGEGTAPEIILETRLDRRCGYIAAHLLSSANTEIVAPRKDGKIKIFEAAGMNDEVENLAHYITKGVIHGARYDDFTVVACNPEVYPAVRRIFGRFGIPYYINEKFTVAEHCLGRFVCGFARLYKNNFAAKDVSSFVKNYLFDGGADSFAFERYVMKFNISRDFSVPFVFECPELNGAERIRIKLNDLAPPYKLPHHDLADRYVMLIKDLIVTREKIYEKYSQMESDPVAAAFTRQVKSKIYEILGQTKRILHGVTLTVEEFSRLLESGFAAAQLSVIPQNRHCVNVLPIEHARLHSLKHLCVIGAGEGFFPATIGDFSLLDDKTLSALEEINVKIEPSVRTLNKRARFNVSQLMCEPFDDLYLSCSDRDSASLVFLRMQKLFLQNEPGEKIYPSRYSALYKLLNDTARGNCTESAALYYALDKPSVAPVNILENIGIDTLPCETVSVSRVETFYSCPYKYFLQYRMNLKEVERFELDTKQFGILMHEILEKYFSELIKDPTISHEGRAAHNSRIRTIFVEAISGVSYSAYLKNPAMRVFLDRVAAETSDAVFIMREYIGESDFKPAFTEYRFGSRSDFSIGDFYLRGTIDRIDVCGDLAVIYDYKSNDAKFEQSKFDAGINLQLLTYADALSSLNLKCAGFYYVAISPKNKRKTVEFNGKCLDDLSIISALDHKFADGESVRLGVKLNRDGSLKNNNKTLSKEKLDEYIALARSKVIAAAEAIKSGEILPSPYIGACDFCPYVSVCYFRDVQRGVPKPLGKNKKSLTAGEADNGLPSTDPKF